MHIFSLQGPVTPIRKFHSVPLTYDGPVTPEFAAQLNHEVRMHQDVWFQDQRVGYVTEVLWRDGVVVADVYFERLQLDPPDALLCLKPLFSEDLLLGRDRHPAPREARLLQWFRLERVEEETT